MRKLPLAVLALTALLFANQAAQAQMGTDNNPMAVKGWDSVASAPCPLGGLPFNTNCKLPDGGSSSGGSVTAASGAFVDCAITTIGCEADTPWSGTGSATLVAAIKAMTLASQGPGVAQTAKGVDLGAVEAAQVTPAAGTASSITTGGTAVTLVTCPCLGGFITNPPNLASQGIAGAENFYVDMVGTPGSTDANGNGTTVILQAGQTFYIPAAPTGVVVKGNAATSGHKVSVEKW